MLLSYSSDSSDYSDWTANPGKLQPPKRVSQRKIKRRRFSSSTEEELLDVIKTPDHSPEKGGVVGSGSKKRGKRKPSEVFFLLDV